MTTENKTQTTANNNQPKNMKLIGTIFSYGGVQKATGNPIVTFVVSNPYKNKKGETKWNKVLEASLILQKEVSKDLPWEKFVTEEGTEGIRARVSFYGTIDIDRREQEKGKQEFKFWLNPIVRDNRQMVFGLVKRADAPAPAEAKPAVVPGDNTPAKHKELLKVEALYRANDYALLKEWLACDGSGFESEGYEYEHRIPNFGMQSFINRMEAEMNAKAAKKTPAAKVKAASAKAKAKVTPISADADAAKPY